MNGQSITFKEDSSASPSLAGRCYHQSWCFNPLADGTEPLTLSIHCMVSYGAIDNYGTLTLKTVPIPEPN